VNRLAHCLSYCYSVLLPGPLSRRLFCGLSLVRSNDLIAVTRVGGLSAVIRQELLDMMSSICSEEWKVAEAVETGAAAYKQLRHHRAERRGNNEHHQDERHEKTLVNRPVVDRPL